MGCKKLTYYESQSPLKVVYRKTEPQQKVVQRFLSVDPLASKYPGVSPYAYVANNPIRYIDPDGRYLVDANGYVMYTQKGGWTKYATADAQRIGNAMMATRTGTSQWNKMVSASHPITLTISSVDKTTTNANGSKSYLLGTTQNTKSVNTQTGKATVTKSDITIYEGTINTYMNNTKNSTSDKAQSYQNNTTNNDERIGAVAGHESVHATDQTNIQQSTDNKMKGTTYDVEVVPNQIEMNVLDETGVQNMQPIEPKKLEQIPNPLPTLQIQ